LGFDFIHFYESTRQPDEPKIKELDYPVKLGNDKRNKQAAINEGMALYQVAFKG
jgi:hypothetical protein